MADSDKIPREILRWLQSLDLAYSIKNPRRDFANGFLVAEIFYRYYVKVIQIHSYDNGISLANRKGNWGLLRKFFKKQQIPLTDEDIDAVMYSRPGQVVGVLKKMYTFLTQRKVKETPQRTSNLPAPPFMKPTAAQAIRDTLGRGGDQIDDRTKKEATVREALDSHNEMLADTRSIDANRDTGVHKVLKGETRKIVKAAPQAQVVVKKVQVKSVDRSIAQLRAKQAAANSQTSVLQGTPNDFHGTGKVDPVMPKFDEAVSFALGPENSDVVQDRDDVAEAFMERVDSAQPLDPALSVRILLDAFGSQVAAAAESAIASPREFHKAFHVLSVPLRLRSGEVFEAACRVLGAFGRECAALDGSTTRSLFLDLALGVVVRIAGNLPPGPLLQLMQVCGDFMGPRAIHRLELLKCIRDSLFANNDAVLVNILASTATLERAGAVPTELAGLYTLYCKGGLTAARQEVRMACVGMLRHIARWAAAVAATATAQDRSPLRGVAEMVPSLLALLGDSEVGSAAMAEVLQTAVVVLGVLEAGAGEGKEELEEKVWAVVDGAADSLRLQWLSVVVPGALSRGMKELLKLEPQTMMGLLNAPESRLHEAWDPAAAAGAVADIVVDNRQENLEPPQMQLLASIATHAAALNRITGEHGESQWSTVLDKIGKYVFVALTDAVLVEAAVEFLSVFFLGGSSEAGLDKLRLEILERKHLVSSMMLLFRDGDVQCQEKVCAMLSAALDTGGQAAAADVAAFVNSLEQYISDPTEGVQALLEKAQQFDEEANAV